MLNIAIVDDEQVHRDILVRYIEEWKERKRCEAEAETLASTEAFYFAWCGQQQYDVLFLDIMMGGLEEREAFCCAGYRPCSGRAASRAAFSFQRRGQAALFSRCPE